MAKSLKNFITIEDALAKYSADELKLFFLSSHYASPLDFNEEKMHEVRKNIERFSIFFAEAEGLKGNGVQAVTAFPEILKKHQEEFLKAMDDDFNTPRALASIFEMITDTYKLKGEKNYPGIFLKAAEVVQGFGCDIFGLSMNFLLKDLTAEEAKIVQERQQARAQKDFKRSDELRDALKELGIIVEDTSGGQKWRRL
jgi:cysteinyl-tRNA synthetase